MPLLLLTLISASTSAACWIIPADCRTCVWGPLVRPLTYAALRCTHYHASWLPGHPRHWRVTAPSLPAVHRPRQGVGHAVRPPRALYRPPRHYLCSTSSTGPLVASIDVGCSCPRRLIHVPTWTMFTSRSSPGAILLGVRTRGHPTTCRDASASPIPRRPRWRPHRGGCGGAGDAPGLHHTRLECQTEVVRHHSVLSALRVRRLQCPRRGPHLVGRVFVRHHDDAPSSHPTSTA
ncbi:uncharacterized protein SCHCODRAFT_02141407 [Schizophyllum commune H4-8]|uniref:uncharacterized protein n=1 Tax=Schizophyllum commune (strain H4-8 / FGSC 9210) TaxID=578458 RepID=UPI00215FFBB7|nr:uncharacterized protein SCHCODRAFT_02141407 [Schizophyllum commune H4-8]KAI5897417.1 hypothetical protein SCHCODRAFT_02141407 [Schizophyllum commune H4-8]